MAISWSVFGAFLVVSTTSLLPWNLFMNAHEYFDYKLRNVTEDVTLEDSKTELQRTFEGWVTATSGVSCIFGALLNTLSATKLSNSFRVLFGHGIVLVSFLPHIIGTYMDTDSWQTSFFVISLFFSSLASFGANGLVGGGVLGLSALFPPVYMQSVMLGQALSGIISSVLAIACQALTQNQILNGRIYFFISTFWTLLSIAAYIFLTRAPLTKQLTTRSRDSQREEVRGLIDSDEDERGEDGVPSLQLRHDDSSLWRRAFAKSWPELGCGAIVLGGTLAAFPAVASLVMAQSGGATWKAYFTAVFCFLFFNLGDAAGRILSHFIHFSFRGLALASFLRLVLIPLICVNAVEPRFHTPTLISSDFIFAALILSLAVSNGLLLTSACCQATAQVDISLKEVTGGNINFVCVVASLVGSFAGLGIVSVL